MATTKTYILAPNFTTQPGGPYQLGAVIADPFRPSKALSLRGVPAQRFSTLTHEEFDRSFTQSNENSISTSVWTHFLQSSHSSAGTVKSTEVVTKYTMDVLETHYLRQEPTDRETKELAQDPNVRAAMNAGLVGMQPVYIITGLKIAKGFRLTTETIEKSTPKSGSKTGGSQSKEVNESLRAGNDIVFAYQLHVMAPRAHRKKQVTMSPYVPKSAFLSDDDGENLEKDVFESSAITAQDLVDFAAEDPDVQVQVNKAEDHAGPCLCVSLL